jgi:hypothetical protein
MADDSLIDEMRAAIRGDRERAEQRRSQARSLPGAEPRSQPAVAVLHDGVSQPELDTDARRAGWSRWLRRRH